MTFFVDTLMVYDMQYVVLALCEKIIWEPLEQKWLVQYYLATSVSVFENSQTDYYMKSRSVSSKRVSPFLSVLARALRTVVRRRIPPKKYPKKYVYNSSRTVATDRYDQARFRRAREAALEADDEEWYDRLQRARDQQMDTLRVMRASVNPNIRRASSDRLARTWGRRAGGRPQLFSAAFPERVDEAEGRQLDDSLRRHIQSRYKSPVRSGVPGAVAHVIRKMARVPNGASRLNEDVVGDDLMEGL